jgi:hypothetical protein
VIERGRVGAIDATCPAGPDPSSRAGMHGIGRRGQTGPKSIAGVAPRDGIECKPIPIGIHPIDLLRNGFIHYGGFEGEW